MPAHYYVKEKSRMSDNPLGEGWALGSGLLENEDVWVQGASFAFDADYNSGQSVCCVLNVQCGDGRLEKILLPVGDGWEPGPGGSEVRREDGNATRQVQKQSAYGQWIGSVIDIAKVDPACMAVLQTRTNVKEAVTWLGLGFHVARKEEKYTMKDRQTQQMIERTTQRLIAESFLGVMGQAAPAPVAPTPVAPPPAPVAPPVAAVQPVAAPGAAPVAPPVIAPPPPPAPVQQAPAPVAAPPAPGQYGGSGDPATMLQLTNIAKTVPDHNTWMLQAFAVPGVMGTDLETGVTDTSDAGLFLRLRAS